MTSTITTCQHVDVALSLMQTIRERDTTHGDAPAAVEVGHACGKPSIGSVDTGDGRRHFCSSHVLLERVLRD